MSPPVHQHTLAGQGWTSKPRQRQWDARVYTLSDAAAATLNYTYHRYLCISSPTRQPCTNMGLLLDRESIRKSIPTYGVMWWWAAAYSDLRNKQHIQRSTGGRARDGHSIRICFPRCACCLLLVLWNRYQFHMCSLWPRSSPHQLGRTVEFSIMCDTFADAYSIFGVNEWWVWWCCFAVTKWTRSSGTANPNQFLVTIMKVLRFVLPWPVNK